MHGGYIPDYRGANVLNWAVANGEPSLGVTWHGLIEAVDAGPIYAESSVSIGPENTAWDVRGAMLREGARQFPEAWRWFVASDPLRWSDLADGSILAVRHVVATGGTPYRTAEGNMVYLAPSGEDIC